MNPLDNSGSGKCTIRLEPVNAQNENVNLKKSQESDDVHSLCSSISNLPTRTITFSQSLNTTSTQLSTRSTKSLFLKKKYEELAILPLKIASFTTIRFEKQCSVQEFKVFGDNPSFKKQTHRGTNNPWRRYGPLMKLHEIGGYAPETNDKKERKNREKMNIIKKNSKPPPQPKCSQMTLNKVREKGKSYHENKLILQAPKNAGVDIAAQKLANQVKSFVLNHGTCLLDSTTTEESNN